MPEIKVKIAGRGARMNKDNGKNDDGKYRRSHAEHAWISIPNRSYGFASKGIRQEFPSKGIPSCAAVM